MDVIRSLLQVDLQCGIASERRKMLGNCKTINDKGHCENSTRDLSHPKRGSYHQTKCPIVKLGYLARLIFLKIEYPLHELGNF